MPELDDKIEDLESSPKSTLDEETVEASEQQPSDDADSSPATGETDDDLLNVVRDAVTEGESEAEASPAEGEEDGQKTDEKTPTEQDDENFSDVPFSSHPRFRQLIRQRNRLREDAERYNNVQTFLDNSGLSADEAADGLTVMGLMKTNPVEAWKRIKPTVQKLLVAAGEVLPDDLRQMVSEGKMDQGAALEVSRSRAAVQATQAQRSFEEQRTQRQTQNEAVQALGNAANTWEADRRRKDPNFDTKLVPLTEKVRELQQVEGKPPTPEGVKAQLDRAYKAVNAALAPAQPSTTQQRKPELKPVMGGQVAGNQRPAEQSTLEIIRANRRAS